MAHLLSTVVIGTVLACAAIWIAPGRGIDEREFDPRLSAASVARIRAATGRRNLLAFYADYCRGLTRGDLGESLALARPIGGLLRERAPMTLRAGGIGLAGAWAAALALAMLCAALRSASIDRLSAALSSVLLCLPAAALGLLTLLVAGESGRALMASTAIALVVFPRLYGNIRGILADAQSSPHVACAMARGVHGLRLIACHILAPSAVPLLALGSVSTMLAFGAAIPVEVVCDVPGIGQLAWQAALQRDFPLLVNLSLLVCLLVALSHALSDACVGLLRRVGP